MGTTDSLPPGPTGALEGAIADSLEGPIRDGMSKGLSNFAEAITKSDPSNQPSPGDSLTKGHKNTHDWEVSKRS